MRTHQQGTTFSNIINPNNHNLASFHVKAFRNMADYDLIAFVLVGERNSKAFVSVADSSSLLDSGEPDSRNG